MGQRNQAMEGFRRGRYRVLVATDIASRGIDISMIELVVNYDLPDDAENYVHRIGRTGRAGKEGHAVTLATPTQSHDIHKIESLIKMTLPRSMHPQFADARFDSGGDGPIRPSEGRDHPSRGRSKPKSQGHGQGFKSKTTQGFSGPARKRNDNNPGRHHKRR